MRIPHLIIVTFTLISASISWSQSPTKVVLEDMGNVGFRISDAQSLANWVSNALAKRVGHDNVAYEGLLKSKKDLARRLGNTEIHPTQAADIQRLEAFVKEAQVWVKARFGKNKKGHWVTVVGPNPAKDKRQRKKRLYANTFHDLQPLVRTALTDFCGALIPKVAPAPARAPNTGNPALLPPKPTPKKQKWLPPTRR